MAATTKIIAEGMGLIYTVVGGTLVMAREIARAHGDVPILHVEVDQADPVNASKWNLIINTNLSDVAYPQIENSDFT